MPLIQVLPSPKLKEGQIRFNGKLFRGVRKRTGNREEMLISDLQDLIRNQIIIGKPIHEEHQGPPVGRIERAWVDIDDWLCIEGKIFGRKKLGNLHDQVRHKLRTKHYKELSISFVRTVLPDGTHKNHQFVEASLTEKGRIEGSMLYSVMASAESSRSEAHAFTPDAEFTFTMSDSQLETMVARLNTEYDAGISMQDLPSEGAHEYLRRMELSLEKLKKVSEERIAQMQQEQEAKDKTLNRLLAQEEERKRQQDEIELKTADKVSEILNSKLPKEKRAEYNEALREMAVNPDSRKGWEMVQTFALLTKELKDSKSSLSSELTRVQNEFKETQKNLDSVQAERDTFRSQLESGTEQAVMNSMKRKTVGVDEKEVGGEKRQKTEAVKLSDKEARAASLFPEAFETTGKDATADEWAQKLRNDLLGLQSGSVLPWTRDSLTITSERRNTPT